MQSIGIVQAFVNGEVNPERFGIAESGVICSLGWEQFFGARWIKGTLVPDTLYLFCYVDSDESLPCLGQPDIVLRKIFAIGFVNLWELK